MAEHGSQERLYGSTVEQEDERRIAEVRSSIAELSRIRCGISETVYDAIEIIPFKTLNGVSQAVESTSPSDSVVLDRKHPFHRIEIRTQLYIMRNLPDPQPVEVTEEIKRAA